MGKTILTKLVFLGLRLLGGNLIHNPSISVIRAAEADIDGMSHREFRRDREFKKAVRYIVESCAVSGSSIAC